MNNVGRLALRVPVLGWLIHDAVHGLPDAKYYFIVNCLLVLAMLIYTIGYPLVIILALSATAGALFLRPIRKPPGRSMVGMARALTGKGVEQVIHALAQFERETGRKGK